MVNNKERNLRDHGATAHDVADKLGLTDPSHADLEMGHPNKTGHHFTQAVGSGLKATEGLAKTGVMITEGLTLGVIGTGIAEGAAILTELIVPHIAGLPEGLHGATGNVGLDIAIDAGIILAGLSLTVGRTLKKIGGHLNVQKGHILSAANHANIGIASAAETHRWAGRKIESIRVKKPSNVASA